MQRRVFWGFPFSERFALSSRALCVPQEHKIIKTENLHSTIVFLGSAENTQIETIKKTILPAELCLGFAGFSNEVIFLPAKRKARVIALSGRLAAPKRAARVWKFFKNSMEHQGFKMEERPWLFHVTLARSPFHHIPEWERLKFFECFKLGRINLYESFPNSEYKPLLSVELVPAYERTGKKLILRGEDYPELFLNSIIASAEIYFKRNECPERLHALIEENLKNNLVIGSETDIITELRNSGLIPANQTELPVLTRKPYGYELVLEV